MVLSESAYRLDTAAITVEVTFVEQQVACNPFEAVIGVTVHTEAVAIRVEHTGHAALAESFDAHQPKQSVNHRPSSIHLNGLGARDPSG